MLGVLLLASAAHAQISPGPLARAHQFMSGPTGCTRCHAVSAGTPIFQCLDCHKEIRLRLDQHRGLHFALIGNSFSNTTCVKCHSEHNGENFPIVKWDPAPGHFDHGKAGFPLDGRHAGIACAKCHNAQRIQPADRPLLSSKDLNHTFLGLSRACTTCHEDKHRGQLGNNCAQCHNASDWKALTFNHARTRFALTGAHLQVACQKCHTPLADGTPKWMGLRFERCASCHADVHRGAFPQTCESCHNTSAWKRTAVATHFDHSKTVYPLLGKHLEVACETCHHGTNFKAPVAHQVCADCHKPDPHSGQFARRVDGGQCESCHTVNGFKPAVFDVARHDTTAFPLHGRHATIACAKCHLPAGKATVFKGVKFALCTDCHQDAHHGQFAAAPYLNRCQQCHDESSYHPSTFTLVRHQQTHFPLTGAHLAAACSDCHKQQPSLRAAVYHFDRTDCTTCHTDPHGGRFRAFGAKTSGDNCENCHVTKTWNDISRFDHNATEFRLTGAHRSVECAACHRAPNLERKLLKVNFGTAPSQCEACHQDPHDAQFAGHTNRQQCADCHTTAKWRPSLFDHETTAFSLQGGHQNVQCAACHANYREVNGVKVLFYKPTPTACAACHASAIVKRQD